MVARWLQTKKLKLKKQRRAWAKPLSVKGPALDKTFGYVAEDGKFVDFSLRSRAKVGASVPDPWLESIFKDNNPLYKTENGEIVPNEEGIFARAQGQNAHPRAIVLNQLMQSKGNAGSLQKEIPYVCEKVLDGRYLKLYLYFSGDSAFFVEGKLIGDDLEIRRSIVYPGREYAKRQHGYGRVCYVQIHSSPRSG